jgi:hypothetical protein
MDIKTVNIKREKWRFCGEHTEGRPVGISYKETTVCPARKSDANQTVFGHQTCKDTIVRVTAAGMKLYYSSTGANCLSEVTLYGKKQTQFCRKQI